MNNQTLQQYIQTAWYFASSILWPAHDFSDDEVRKALSDIEFYFNTATDLQEAYNSFCGRVLSAAADEKKCPILHPRLWLNPINVEGLTSPDFKGLKSRGHRTPVFDKVTSIIAKAYFHYINNPSLDAILKCSDDLDAIGQKSWMSYFYQALQHRTAA